MDKLISSLDATIVAVAVSTIGYKTVMPQATDSLTTPLFYVVMFLWLGLPLWGYLCTLVAMRFYRLNKESMLEVQQKCAGMRASQAE